MQPLAPNKENLPKVSIVCESYKLTEECWIPCYWDSTSSGRRLCRGSWRRELLIGRRLNRGSLPSEVRQGSHSTHSGIMDPAVPWWWLCTGFPGLAIPGPTGKQFLPSGSQRICMYSCFSETLGLLLWACLREGGKHLGIRENPQGHLALCLTVINRSL